MNKLMIKMVLALAVTSTVYAQSSCKNVLNSLGLKKTSESLGLSGSVDITDKTTNETVRIFLSQTGTFKNSSQERYDFSTGGIKNISGSGKLFVNLNKRTNIHILNIMNSGCEVGFYPREVGANSILVSKLPKTLGINTLTLEGAANSANELENELDISYHGNNID